MLDEITPEQFDEWIAFRKIEPDPNERLREIVKRGFAAMIGGDVKPEMLDEWDEKNKPVEVKPKEAFAMAKAAYKRTA